VNARAQLTEEDGYEALRGHVIDKAVAARRRHGPVIDAGAILRVLSDPEIVRFPTELVFASSALLPGEFACPLPKGEHPKQGFTLAVHELFANQPEALPYLVAYHIPSINYLDVVTNREAELFGAALLGLEVDEYYRRLCALADQLPGGHAVTPPPASHSCACGSSGGCGG
jgi:hypothetical protein